MAIGTKLNELASWTLLAAGLAAFFGAAVQLPLWRVSAGLLIFTVCALLFSSFVQIHIPRTKFYFTISDTLIFVALLNFGGEAAVMLATLESLFSSLNFKRRGISIKTRTLFLNGAIAAVTTTATVSILRAFFESVSHVSAYGTLSYFVQMLCVMALAQFFFNSVLVAGLSAFRDDKSFFKIWYDNCFNAVVFYVAGAFSAGFLTKSLYWLDPFLIATTVIFSAAALFIYRRYLIDVKDSAAKAERAERERAEQAENHILELRRHIAEQERISRMLHQSRESFRQAAFHDSLTNLPNRNYFIGSLKESLEKSHQPAGKKFAVLFLNLNRFKTINDSLGHAAGDRLIINVAKRLSSLVRDGDFVARFSGDEFAIILHDIAMTDDAVGFAETIRRKLVTSFNISGRQVFTSVSIGIAVSDAQYKAAEDILRDADIAMCYAKERNKDFVVFNQTMHTRAVNLLQLETDMRSAVENEEMLVYYQPIVDLSTMRLHGFEALMRWNHPERGLVAPTEFITVAEATNYIVPLTLWILQKSCRQLAAWHARSPENAHLMMSVNLSGKHFAQPDVVEQIRWILKDTGVNPACLKLEITESAIMENAENTIQTLKNLRSLGVRLSIDDFGTGYSSLSYLHRFPIDTLKVDRSFVSSMEDGSENGEIVRTVIALARTLRLDVVAEGIESIHQLHQLRILGCEYGQGYLFSRPVPLEDAQAILDDKSRWQNIIPNNNPAMLARNREFTHLRLMNN